MSQLHTWFGLDARSLGTGLGSWTMLSMSWVIHQRLLERSGYEGWNMSNLLAAILKPGAG